MGRNTVLLASGCVLGAIRSLVTMDGGLPTWKNSIASLVRITGRSTVTDARTVTASALILIRLMTRTIDIALRAPKKLGITVGLAIIIM